MKKYLLTIALVLVLIPSVIVLASDTSSALFRATVTVFNNSTATTNVATVLTANTAAWQDADYINASCNNTALVSGSGADVPYMPGYGDDPWAIWVPSIGNNAFANSTLYLGGSDNMSGKIRYFPGDAGMTVTDDASMELGNNGSISASGYIDTDAGADKCLFEKKDAIKAFVSPTVSGNITALVFDYLFADDFDTDDWTDVGTKIVVDTGDERLEYESERSAVDTRSGYDLTAVSDTGWKLDFTLRNTTSTAANAEFVFGLGSSFENESAYSGDAVFMRIATATPVVFIKSYDAAGAGGDNSSSITISNGVTYYVTLERTSATEASLSVFSDSARTTHIAGSPVTLTIAATLQGLRYVMGSNADSGTGAANEQIGWLDDVFVSEPEVAAQVSATGVSSGKHDVAASANTTHLNLIIDDVLEDSIALGGVSVFDNVNDYVFFQNGAMPYVESASIDVGGSPVSAWAWEYGTTFEDSIGSNDATPTFRTASSDADVSASITYFAPITTAIAPAFAVSDAPLLITANITASGNFTSGNVTTGGPPGFSIIDEAAEAGGTPNIWLWGILAICAIAGTGLAFSYFEKDAGGGPGTLTFRAIAMIVIFALMITFGKFDWWMMIFFVIIIVGLAMASRQGEIGGVVSQHGLIGFLAQSWIGMTLINRVLEGQFITANERVWSNYFAFTQEFKVFDIFSMPVLNLQFFTHGMPSLIKWDYSFFGGNAQLFQYLLYSITAVVSFVIFGIFVGLLYNAFRVR